MAVKRVPDGYHRVTPHLTVRDAAKMIEFYKKAFGAVEKRRALGAGWQDDHARRDQDRRFVLVSERRVSRDGRLSPLDTKGTPVTLHLLSKTPTSNSNRRSRPGQKW